MQYSFRMASLRSSIRLFNGRSAFRRVSGNVERRLVSSQANQTRRSLLPLVGASAGLGIYLAHKFYNQEKIFPIASAASTPNPQATVFSQGKKHGLYLWIHLKPEADLKACARTALNIDKYVDIVVPPKERDEDDEILAGVGFGSNLLQQIGGKSQQNYVHPHRKGQLGDMPSSGGDIFIHAKSDNYSNLFDLAQTFLKHFPKGSIEQYEDIYGFTYRNGRDLSGFIDGTENPAADDDRERVAVEKSTGGSYCITQKWIHDMDVIHGGKVADKTMENWVGRGKADSVEQYRKTVTSHVTRMTGGANFEQQKVHEIVRQSQPYGTNSGEAGLFFIGYAESPVNFEYMLDRMVGAGGDGHSDDIMRLTKCVKGTYWYFPSLPEVEKLKLNVK